MNPYLELKERHQREVNALPLYFAFNDKQFIECLQQLGLTLEDTDQLRSLGVGGGFYHKDEGDNIFKTFTRHTKECEEAIAGDTKGDGYIYEMFVYELNNHEYGYTWDVSSTLNALDLTLDDIEKNKALKYGFNKAVKYVKAQNK